MAQSKTMELKRAVAPFEQIDPKASIKQIANTIPPLLVLWAAAYFSLSVSYWLTLPIVIAAAGFMVRTFILFHDCCHQSFFKNKLANDILGTITGVLTLVPYEQWKRSHSIHHATSGNLDKRGIGDVWIMTVQEYADASLWTKIRYTIYRHPLVLFGLGPIALFLIQHRFNDKGARRKERWNLYLTNMLIAGLYSLLIWLVGWQAFLLIQAPIFYLASVMGIWLFYVQHQFEDSYFENEEEWSYVQAAVEGSSYYKLPRLLQWISGNIGFHHVHHLSPRVPNYNLEKAHEAAPPLQMATTITLSTSLKALRYRLWNEETRTFMSFREARAYLVKKREAQARSEAIALAAQAEEKAPAAAGKSRLAAIRPGLQGD
ncbi:fatty acid desaturase [Xylanibacillus composti]|uniref:Fatty acid desaturase n=1 Tax=Xylanibacillus composti TaxID=1572762 RepID=A0A8J4H1D3_9BACL|nr:fatty acid desaturase [Xylanibacillus composti]MDT9723921.1 fatty acid desaturase [Xylanibacillus composti]GIQ67801.1 fatty acid desaturase [Xylanibacillus composti]